MLRRLIVALALLLAALPAGAVSVSAVPAEAYIDGVGSGTFTIRWAVTVTGPGQRVTIVSTNATIQAGNQNRPAGGMIRRTVNHPGGSSTTYITERVRIDSSSAAIIREVGDGTYFRMFDDGISTPTSGAVEITLRSSGSGGLSLRNFSLAFDDRSRYRVVGRGSALTGFVTVTSSGRGIFQGDWELAGPTGGFRPIGRERVPLGGPRATTFESPQLPTDRPGVYRLRFSPGGSSDFANTSPEITYVVVPGEGTAAIALRSPSDNQTLTGATRFQWTEVPGAARYRIEFRVPGESRPIAAADTPDTLARLRPFTLARLKGNGQITWRIVAFDAAGTAIATSQERVLAAGGTFLQGSP